MARSPRRDRDDPYAVFRPVAGRLVPLVVALVMVVMFVGLAATLTHVGPADRVSIVALGGVFVAAMWRFAQVRAIPTTEGLEVHNLIVTRTVAWTQVVQVQFGGGQQFVVLELDDFDTLSVMGIQRADGPRSQLEAERLAALVQAHSRPPAGTDD